MLSQATSSFENCMYLKLTYFLHHNLILFPEKNYKKQAQMFYQKTNLKKALELTYCTQIDFIEPNRDAVRKVRKLTCIIF